MSAPAFLGAARHWALPSEGTGLRLDPGGCSAVHVLTAPPSSHLREEPSLGKGSQLLVFVFQPSGDVSSHPEHELGTCARLMHGPKDARS